MAAPARVLVVDDSEDFRDTVTAILADAGYDVRSHAGDRLSADAIAEMDPDLVVLDLVLHGHRDGATGWDLLEVIRGHPRLASVPVIVCSADASQLHAHEAELTAVAATYALEKPFSLEQFETAVSDALEANGRPSRKAGRA